jgi:hypothetical protein
MTTYILYTRDDRPIPIWDGSYVPREVLDSLPPGQECAIDKSQLAFDPEAAGIKLKQYLDMLSDYGVIEEADML